MNFMMVIGIFLTSFVFALLCVPLIIRFAKKNRLYDLPDTFHTDGLPSSHGSPVKRKVHSQPTPRLGGVAIVLGFFSSLFLWKFPGDMASLYVASFMMFSLGLIDDLKSLSAKIKLFVQIFSASFAVFMAKLNIIELVLWPDISFRLPYLVGFFLSVFIIVGAINAINMADGLDGLASGIVLISICLLSYIHFLNTEDIRLLVVFSIPLIGSTLGFLNYNTHPSSIFMGDSGSNWLGFMLGILILFVAKGSFVTDLQGHWFLVPQGSLAPLPFLSIVLCISIPVFDTALVIFSRLRAGKNPMNPDKRHFHHSLMKIGFTHSQSVIMVYFFMICFSLFGLLPVIYPQKSVSWIPLFGIFLVIFCLSFSFYAQESSISNLKIYRFFSKTRKKNDRIKSKIFHYWENLNRYVIYCILLATPFLSGVVPKSVGYAAALMATVLFFALFIKNSDSFLEAFLIALASTVLLTANNSNIIWIEIFGRHYNLQSAYNSLFIFLFLSTLCFFVLTFRRKYFIIGPTDFLFILLPLLIFLLPKEIQIEYKLNIIALRSFILFAALRTFSRRQSPFFYKIHFACIISLAWIALTTLADLRLVY